MARIELSIASDYVNWGVPESVRELIQNAKDAEDVGLGQAIIKYRPSSQTLKITSKGALLTRDKLVLGITTKREDDRQRGQFGEGFKLAFASLLREGVEIVADVGTENWRPAIEHSDTFGCEILVIHTRGKADSGEIAISLKGVTQDHWDEIQGNTLFLQKSVGKHIDTYYGKVLMSKKHRGRLYCRGLYVCRLPERDHNFGYDLPNLEIDRDRRMVDPWDVKYGIRQAITSAFRSDHLSAKDVYSLLDSDTAEGKILGSQYVSLDPSLQQALADLFCAKHGENSIPVESISESFAVEHLGKVGIVVRPELRHALGRIFPAPQELISKMSTEAKRVYSPHELTEKERDFLMWTMDLVENYMSCDPKKMRIVDFHGDGVLGVYRDGSVDIAKKILENKEELIATVVHEYAHRAGADGSVQHEREIERIFAKIIVKLSGFF